MEGNDEVRWVLSGGSIADWERNYNQAWDLGDGHTGSVWGGEAQHSGAWACSLRSCIG